MGDTRPIQSLTADEVRGLLREATRSELPIRALNELLASIDWSTALGPVPQEVGDILDEAAALVIEFEEGDLDAEAFHRSITDLVSTSGGDSMAGRSRLRA